MSDRLPFRLYPRRWSGRISATAEPGRNVNLEVDVLAKYVEAADGGKGMSSSRVGAPFATIEEAIEDIRQGKMVVVVDDENRENEGDLTIAAQFVTPETINFMTKEGRGLICLALTAGAVRRARPGPDGGEERVRVRDGVHGLDRGPGGSHDRDLGARPRAHDPGGDRPADGPARARPARATSSR